MKKSICISALLVLLPLSVAQADLEFSPFPFKVAGPTMADVLDETQPVEGSSTLLSNTLVQSDAEVPVVSLEGSPSLEVGHGVLHEGGISSGG